MMIKGNIGRLWSRLSREEAGMTLVELMIVIVLIGIISGGLLALLIDTQKLFGVSQKFADAADHARIGMDRMSKDVRQAERMVVTTGYEIRFRQYFDDDKQMKIIGYRVEPSAGKYSTLDRYVDNTPYDASPGTWTPVANYIQNRSLTRPLFTYHLPQSIGITIVVDDDNSIAPSPVTLNASVQPRNQNKQEW